mmetsp:Transcript_3116/g.6885  ORF Transcript_3116/g.6885 Transcript_3116/m.6885 type:complete len:203 (-) Transcript_3116:18-626(-)
MRPASSESLTGSGKGAVSSISLSLSLLLLASMSHSFSTLSRRYSCSCRGSIFRSCRSASVSSSSSSPVNFPVTASRLYLGGLSGPRFPRSFPSWKCTPKGSSSPSEGPLGPLAKKRRSERFDAGRRNRGCDPPSGRCRISCVAVCLEEEEAALRPQDARSIRTVFVMEQQQSLCVCQQHRNPTIIIVIGCVPYRFVRFWRTV